ncbi:hypothetical protein DFH11DRAFT_1780790 [Phellopilus nigrolimitatus]|nr:hypothetical protein DFH11DRAFT_1780790 [Phellopilus nigrolimitatus]
MTAVLEVLDDQDFFRALPLQRLIDVVPGDIRNCVLKRLTMGKCKISDFCSDNLLDGSRASNRMRREYPARVSRLEPERGFESGSMTTASVGPGKRPPMSRGGRAGDFLRGAFSDLKRTSQAMMSAYGIPVPSLSIHCGTTCTVREGACERRASGKYGNKISHEIRATVRFDAMVAQDMRAQYSSPQNRSGVEEGLDRVRYTETDADSFSSALLLAAPPEQPFQRAELLDKQR